MTTSSPAPQRSNALPDPIEITATQRQGSLVLNCLRVEGLPLPSIHFAVSLAKRGFAGTNPHVGVLDHILYAFVEELAELDRTRQGAATLTSMSPGEFKLRIRTVDRAGHPMLSATVSHYTCICRDRWETDTATSHFEIEPWDLPTLLDGFRTWAEAVAQSHAFSERQHHGKGSLLAHAAQVCAILQRDYTASLLNDTKWMELFAALADLPLWRRLKLVTEPEPGAWTRTLQAGSTAAHLPLGWIEGGGYAPLRCLEIEWLELQPADASGDAELAEIEARLAPLGITSHRIGAILRIVGHVRRVPDDAETAP